MTIADELRETTETAIANGDDITAKAKREHARIIEKARAVARQGNNTLVTNVMYYKLPLHIRDRVTELLEKDGLGVNHAPNDDRQMVISW